MRGRVLAFDGIRAIACLLVVLYHVGVPGLDFGWVGVDIFFVLSGYLITQLLLAERDRRGRISLPRFWLRRAGRLYPALLVAVVLCLAFTPVSRLQLVAAVLYLGDVMRWQGRPMGPLGHTWSLAIEEQFYLAWPVALLFLRSRRAVVIGGLAGTLASALAFLWISPPAARMSETAYNAPHARIWELLAGCVLAALLPLGTASPPAARRAASAVLPVATLAAAWWAWTHPYKDSVLTLLAVTATAAAVVVLRDGGLAARAMSVRPLPHVGQITYGLYLYHFPVLAFAPVKALDLPARTAVALIATFAVAEASYRWVEVPARTAVNRYADRFLAPPLPAPATPTDGPDGATPQVTAPPVTAPPVTAPPVPAAQAAAPEGVSGRSGGWSAPGPR